MKKISENEAKDLKTHLVYAGFYDEAYFFKAKPYEGWERLGSLILKGMKKYKIKSLMVTNIGMNREHLITNEKMLKYCNGKDLDEKESINDDLESLFEDLRLEKEPDEYNQTYFLPRLTEEDLDLVESKDPSYFASFSMPSGGSPDVVEYEMKASESNSKFVQVTCSRRTFPIENSSSPYRSKLCHFKDT